MDFRLSLEQKIKVTALIVNFLQIFEVHHEINFFHHFTDFFKILPKLEFLQGFDAFTIRGFFTLISALLGRRVKKNYLRRAESPFYTILIMKKTLKAPLQQKAPFYSKIATFSKKLTDFGIFSKN